MITAKYKSLPYRYFTFLEWWSKVTLFEGIPLSWRISPSAANIYKQKAWVMDYFIPDKEACRTGNRREYILAWSLLEVGNPGSFFVHLFPKISQPHLMDKGFLSLTTWRQLASWEDLHGHGFLAAKHHHWKIVLLYYIASATFNTCSDTIIFPEGWGRTWSLLLELSKGWYYGAEENRIKSSVECWWWWNQKRQARQLANSVGCCTTSANRLDYITRLNTDNGNERLLHS